MIKLDPKNARIHSEENKALIKKSLKELGAGRSIVIDDEDIVIYKVYCITNKINSKIYIGFTGQNIQLRLDDHIRCAKRGDGYVLHKAIRKHGNENFSISVLYSSCDKDFVLSKVEPFFIKLFDSQNLKIGYNIADGGQGGLSKSVVDQLKKRMVGNKYNLGKKHSKKTRKKMSDWQKGRKLTEEHCNNIRKSKQNTSKETRSRMSNSAKNKDMSFFYKGVFMIDKKTEEILMKFKSIVSAHKFVGIKDGISKVCKGKRKTAGGYKWEYV